MKIYWTESNLVAWILCVCVLNNKFEIALKNLDAFYFKMHKIFTDSFMNKLFKMPFIVLSLSLIFTYMHAYYDASVDCATAFGWHGKMLSRNGEESTWNWPCVHSALEIVVHRERKKNNHGTNLEWKLSKCKIPCIHKCLSTIECISNFIVCNWLRSFDGTKEVATCWFSHFLHHILSCPKKTFRKCKRNANIFFARKLSYLIR